MGVPSSTFQYQKPILVPSFGQILGLFPGLSQASSNKPSRVPSSVPMLEHSDYPSFILTYAPSRDTCTDPIVVPKVLRYQKPLLLHQLFSNHIIIY